jgi:hypothetical protein
MHERLHALVVQRRSIDRSLIQSSEPDAADKTQRNNLLVAEVVILFGLLPPCLVTNLLVGYLAMNMKLSTLKLQIDKDLVGVTGQNYNGWNCHFGVHPKLISKELHLSCSNKNKLNLTYYQSIFPIP